MFGMRKSSYWQKPPTSLSKSVSFLHFGSLLLDLWVVFFRHHSGISNIPKSPTRNLRRTTKWFGKLSNVGPHRQNVLYDSTVEWRYAVLGRRHIISMRMPDCPSTSTPLVAALIAMAYNPHSGKVMVILVGEI